MSTPLFVYLVPTTDWHVIVTLDAGHFYFNSSSRESVWQLAETGMDQAFVTKWFNFDELALLFAKARGLKVQSKIQHRVHEPLDAGDRKSTLLEEITENPGTSAGLEDEDHQTEASADEVANDQETMDLLRSVMAENSIDIVDDLAHGSEEAVDDEEDVNNEGILEQAVDNEVSSAGGHPGASGLSLGYSSSEELDSEELGSEVNDEAGGAREEAANTKGDPSEGGSGKDKDESDHGEHTHDEEDHSNSIALDVDLDLTISTVSTSEEDILAFKRLLDEHRSEISVYDPWFMVEEELLPKIAANAAYYGVADAAAREHIFNAWVAEQENGNLNHAKYPTAELLFYQFLQQHKPDVKKMYYGEFANVHASELTEFLSQHQNVHAENLYRQLRVTLVDFAKYERQHKHENRGGNMKMHHVQQMVSDHEFVKGRISPGETGNTSNSEGSFFAQWVELLNLHGVPESLAHNAANFIVGDEKRFQCYKQALEKPAKQS